MSKVNYVPLGNRCIVRKIEVEEEIKIGSILIPEMAEKLAMGEIVTVGIGEYAIQTGLLIPTEVKVGDRVLFLKEGGHVPLSINGEWYLLMRESNIEVIV